MTQICRILAFAGSTRNGSANKKLARVAARAAVAAQYTVTWIDLRDYPLPLYDADLEAYGLPDGLLRLREVFARHDALIVASPEYNGFFPPVLKNALDWLSRPVAGEGRHAVFANRPVLLLSAVAGRSGGPAGLQQLRRQFTYLTAQPFAKDFVLPLADSAFDDHDRLKNPEQAANLADIVVEFGLSLPVPMSV